MTYAAKLERSGIKIVNTGTGSTVRAISGTFTGAVVQGDEVHCTQSDGRIRIVNIRTGSNVRMI